MLFNIDKCKVMHFGASNLGCTYSMNSQNLCVVTEEKDLGVIVQNNLKVTSQCAKVVKTANRILGMIKRTFTCRKADIVLNLYKTLVRPHLEYCIQAWRPYLRKDIDLLEGVQHRATKIIEGFAQLSYEQRLCQLNLTTLETRRLRGDLIEVYKLVHGLEDISADKFFVLSSGNLRGHRFKLFKKRFSSNIGKYSFSNRVVDVWNKLPDNIVSCNTVASFKGKIDCLFKEVWGFI
jgi:hypothetical protein